MNRSMEIKRFALDEITLQKASIFAMWSVSGLT